MASKLVSVLVVDDEEEITRTLRVHLELRGFEVETAGSGAAALALLDGRRFDIVLLDIRMPAMDGVALLAKIKESHGDTIGIMVTAAADLAKVLSARIYGASDYMLKPFADFEEFDAILQRASHQVKRWDAILETIRQRRQLA